MTTKDNKVVKDIVSQFFDNKYKPSNIAPFEHRSKGAITREKILNAAIEELALNGIKGTTHRAIATRAKIQLSLTTYYFKDIQEVVNHAFMLNANNILIRRESIFDRFFLLLDTFKKSDLRKSIIKEILALQLVDMASNYIIDSIKQESTSIRVEQLMFTEIHFNSHLHQIANEYEVSLLLPYQKLCTYFNNKNPNVDAKILHTIISQLQYEMLTQDNSKLDIESIKETTEKVIGWIMKLKK